MDTTSPNPTVTIICGTVLLVAVLAGVFFLAYHKTITGGAALGVIGTIVGAGVGAFAHQSGVNSGLKTSETATARKRTLPE